MSIINNNLLMTPEGYQISRSVRLRSSASANLNRSYSGTGTSTTTKTFSAWVKRGTLGTAQRLINSNAATATTTYLQFDSGDTLSFNFEGASTTLLTTAQVFRDPSAYYHIVLAIDTTQATAANRVKLYINGTQVTSFGASNYPSLNATTTIFGHASVGNRIGSIYDGTANYFDGYLTEINFIDGQALTPSSFGETDSITGVWKPKKYTGTYGTNGFYLPFSDNASLTRLGFDQRSGVQHVLIAESDGTAQTVVGVGACRISTISTTNYSLPSATNEYLSVTFDSPVPVTSSLKIYMDVNSTWANGRNLYINGTQVSSGNISVATVSGMQEWTINYAAHGVSSLISLTTPQNSVGRAFFYGISVDGTTIYQTANDWTPNNISLTAGTTYDSMIDVPTLYADGGNGRGNYCIVSGVDKRTGTSSVVQYAGLRAFANNTGMSAAYQRFRGTMRLDSPSYWEAIYTTGDAYWVADLGVCTENWNVQTDGTVGASGTNSLGMFAGYDGSRSIVQNGTVLFSSLTWNAGDILQIAYDPTTGYVWIGRNNTWFNSGNPAAGTGRVGIVASPAFPAFAPRNSVYLDVNFGQRPFTYTPPTGFKALNTQNLPDATIKKGNQYFDATAYSGTGSIQSIVNSGGMQPDLLWIKCRSSIAFHDIVDSVRGVNNVLSSNSTAAEVAGSFVTSLNSNGFTLPANVTSDAYYTNIGSPANTFVAWQWKESVSAGFDIVTYTGTGSSRTVAHSLGVAPKMIIVKTRSAVSAWVAYHASLGTGKVMVLNGTNAVQTLANYWDTAPDASNITLGSSSDVNANAATYVAYCFAEVAGYSKFGSYTGNGSADGPFVYCGFRPRWIMVKRTDAIEDWIIYDSARDTYNPEQLYLYPNSSAAEAGSGTARIDFTSNGFKCRNSGQGNVSGGTYIFMVLAENPFKNSLAR